MLLIYLLIRRKYRNVFLVGASLFFYAWGEWEYVLIMLLSIMMNFTFGRLIDRYRAQKLSRLVMGSAIGFNLLLLGFFKYSNFLVDNLNVLLKALGSGVITLPKVHLPIGISFFTFHCISYLVDVYRQVVKVQKKLMDFALYVSLFPQLVAGPIIRYHDIADQITYRSTTVDGLVLGIRRFVIGLGKKVLIANTLATTADQVFSIPSASLSTGLAWLGIICYTLQIYFDFSGYSDMAIGLGRMFGFHFLENFDYPYIAKSIREFWRRWHISLSNWFRDYLYIPLGGNRTSSFRTYNNLLVVFFLCGLWHGAKWNFVIWGMIHGLFLVLERTRFGEWLDKRWAPVRHFYTLIIVSTGWVFFRSETLAGATDFLKVMIGFTKSEGIRHSVSMYMNNELMAALVIGIAGSMPLKSMLMRSYERFARYASGDVHATFEFGVRALTAAGLTFVLFASVVSLANGTYNPFIYFRF